MTVKLTFYLIQFLTSRAGSPAPFRPIRSNTLTNEDLHALEQLTGSPETATANGGLTAKVNIDSLTRQAEQQ